MYVITSFNTSQSTNNFTVSISGKDKMCLLNGDLGGNLPASIDFGTSEYYDLESGVTTYEKIPIKAIIKEALHSYALEPYHNIIINDLDTAGLELLEYRGEDPLYLLYNVRTNEYQQPLRYNYDEDVYLCKIEQNQTILLRDANGNVLTKKIQDLIYDKRIYKLSAGLDSPDRFVLSVETDSSTGAILEPSENTNVYEAAKIEYGQTAGYRITDLIYAGDLISSIGETLTSILDKIKGMLGEFEYFYNLDGQFIFQRKKNYVNQAFNGEVNNDDDPFIDNQLGSNDYIHYRFEGGNLITAYQNNPNLQNLKNDFSIWGVRKSLSGAELPIHYRYAIDKKPSRYTSISVQDNEEDVKTFKAKYPDVKFKSQDSVLYIVSADYLLEGENLEDAVICPWQEIIYQMAHDYYQYGQLDEFIPRIIEANRDAGLYTTGKTGYEQYYIDIQGFWRQLYNPTPTPVYLPETITGNSNDIFTFDINDYPDGLFIDFNYQLYNNEADVNRSDILVLREINNRYELIPLLDTIKVDFGFADTDNDLAENNNDYYINSKITPNTPHGKQLITKGIIDVIQKAEVFKREEVTELPLDMQDENGYKIYQEYDAEGNSKYYKYRPIIETVNKGNNWYYRIEVTDFCKLYVPHEYDKDGNVISYISDIDENSMIRNLFFKDFDNGELYSRMNATQFDKWSGEPAVAGTISKKFIEFYKGDYEYYRQNDKNSNSGWHKNVFDAPDLLNFWFDFLDTEGELEQYQVQLIGDRTKVVNDNNVKSIYFRDVPEILYVNTTDGHDSELIELSNYWHFTRIRNIPISLFNISSQGKSAQDELESLLYNHSYCIESITLTSIPIYHLEPNTRIFVQDNSSKINGEYLVSRISLPLTYNGTMSITATKAPTRLY